MNDVGALEKSIGFDQLRGLIHNECLSNLGRERAEKMHFSTSLHEIHHHTKLTAEFQYILSSGAAFPQENYYDLRQAIHTTSLEGGRLQESEIHKLLLVLITLKIAFNFLKNTEGLPLLKSETAHLSIPQHLIDHIEKTIDHNGLIRDTASTELRNIRQVLRDEKASLRKRLDSIIKHARENGFCDPEAQATIRNGRMVIPLKAEYKRAIKGFIHDESDSGQTVYIEPDSILEINNHIHELTFKETREINKILTVLTHEIGKEHSTLLPLIDILGLFDFLRAKAKISNTIHATIPNSISAPHIQWQHASHPLLMLKSKGEKKVIPLSLTLDQNKRILILSGPNAGGKSVALKTVALIQYMWQCGLPVPVHPDSIFGPFEQILADIGDQQSIDNELSTYSAHLTNLREILTLSNEKTLFLADELGAGTDPVYGGAIAEGLLVALNNKKAFGVVTTHYDNLKKLGVHTKGMMNGRMLFDMHHLQPLFRLETGQPGSSFALEIAQRIGLPKEVTDYASKHVGTSRIEYEKSLKHVDTNLGQLREQQDRTAKKEAQLERAINDYRELKESIEVQRKNMLLKAKHEAETLIKNANKQIEQTIRSIKESKAEKEATIHARKNLDNWKDQHTKPLVEKNIKPQVSISKPLKVQDWVQLDGQESAGKIIQLSGNKAEVQFGDWKLTLPIDQLKHVSGPSKTTKKTERIASQMLDKNISFKNEIDVRGYRTIEALEEVDKLLDQAIMLGSSELRIIHGKGDGILRKMIRNHLKGYHQVESCGDEHIDRGGPGITIVILK